jgi:hypothetical protein
MSIKQIIKEVRGIAESTIPYTHAILNEIDPELHYFVNSSKTEYSRTIEIPYRTLAKYITTDEFTDFPVVKLIIGLNFRYMDYVPEMWEGNEVELFSIGGGAYPIYAGSLGSNSSLSQRVKPESFPVSKEKREAIDRAIIAHVDFDITIYKGFDFFESVMSGFDRELRSVVLHEMMHMYEGYKDKSQDYHIAPWNDRTNKTKKPKSNRQTTKSYFEDTKFHGVPSELTTSLEYLFDLYYGSQAHEVRAKTQEMYPYVLDMSIDEFFKSRHGQQIRKLMEFDYEEFYDLLIGNVIEYANRSGITGNREDEFFEQIRMRVVKDYERSANKNNEVIDTKLVNQKSLKSLIKYLGKQIEKSGRKLFRNVGKLYSLKAELND